MDRAILEQHLAQAEEHVSLGEHHLARQRALISELERDAHGTTEAKRLLTTFEEVQAMHLADRDRLRHELTQEF